MYIFAPMTYTQIHIHTHVTIEPTIVHHLSNVAAKMEFITILFTIVLCFFGFCIILLRRTPEPKLIKRKPGCYETPIKYNLTQQVGINFLSISSILRTIPYSHLMYILSSFMLRLNKNNLFGCPPPLFRRQGQVFCNKMNAKMNIFVLHSQIEQFDLSLISQ